MKSCSSCKLTLPAERFYRDISTKDGLHHQCKACNSQRRAANRKAAPKYAGGDAQRAKAASIAREALRKGLLTREPCFMCGAKAEMHHPAYSSPLLVTWLCRPHHRQVHREMPPESQSIVAVRIGTGERKVLRSMAEGPEHGFLARSISDVCRGHKKSHKGWRFEYAAAPKTGGANG
jgi:hypothetical protein